jgi:hypothetical protein
MPESWRLLIELNAPLRRHYHSNGARAGFGPLARIEWRCFAVEVRQWPGLIALPLKG